MPDTQKYTGVIRIAPSDSSPHLHLGHGINMMYNYFASKSLGLDLVWRLDSTDLDLKTSFIHGRAQMITASKMGLSFKGFYMAGLSNMYQDKVQKLIDSGLIYRALDNDHKLKKRSSIESNLGDHFRLDLKLLGEIYSREDKILQFQGWDWESYSDPVVIRSDGTMTYILYSSMWDILHGVQLVIRGEDLLSTAPISAGLASFFGHSIYYIHHGLLFMDSTTKLSKSSGSTHLLLPVLESYPPVLFAVWCAGNIFRRNLKDMRDLLLSDIARGPKRISRNLFDNSMRNMFRSLSYHLAVTKKEESVPGRYIWYGVRGNCNCMIDYRWWVSRLTEDSGMLPSNEVFSIDESILQEILIRKNSCDALKGYLKAMVKVDLDFSKTIRRILAGGKNSPPASWLISTIRFENLIYYLLYEKE